MSVEALDALVRTFVYTLWVLVAATFVVGAWWLQRTRPGKHRSAIEAVDIGHEPAHARLTRTPWWARLPDAYLASTRELIEARALWMGAQPWT